MNTIFRSTFLLILVGMSTAFLSANALGQAPADGEVDVIPLAYVGGAQLITKMTLRDSFNMPVGTIRCNMTVAPFNPATPYERRGWMWGFVPPGSDLGNELGIPGALLLSGRWANDYDYGLGKLEVAVYPYGSANNPVAVVEAQYPVPPLSQQTQTTMVTTVMTSAGFWY